MPIRKPRRQPVVVQIIWLTLALAFLVALLLGRWSQAFVSLATLALTFVPVFADGRFGIRLPIGFVVWVVVFIFSSIFLGEAFDFYGRFWWWDVVLHAGAALGFGLAGFLFVFMLFEGDRYAAPAWAVAFVAFCFALTVGTIWEIFEFTMDQLFGTNMQKSGLVDTMWDLIVDTVGAAIGGLAGFLFLKKRQLGGLTDMLAEFVTLNRRFFRKLRR